MRIIYSVSLPRAKPLSHSTMLIYDSQYLPLSFTSRAFQCLTERSKRLLKVQDGCASGVSVVLVRVKNVQV